MTPFVELLLRGDSGVLPSIAPYARAFARVAPAASLVPALAIRGAPGPLRAALAIALAAPIATAFPWSPADGSLWPILVGDALAGIPLAIALATPLWVAVHVGTIADILRGAPEATVAPPPAAEGARGPLATLAALLAASTWIASGGTTRALLLLQTPHVAGLASWAYALRALSDGLRLSLALSAGVLVAAVALEAALIGIGRIATPVSPQPVATLARPIVAVIALSISIELAVVTLVSH